MTEEELREIRQWLPSLRFLPMSKVLWPTAEVRFSELEAMVRENAKLRSLLDDNFGGE